MEVELCSRLILGLEIYYANLEAATKFYQAGPSGGSSRGDLGLIMRPRKDWKRSLSILKSISMRWLLSSVGVKDKRSEKKREL